MRELKKEKYYIFQVRNDYALLLTGEELIESINKDNKLYKEKGLEYSLTTNGAMKVLSNLAPQASIEEADVKFFREFDTLEQANKAKRKIDELVTKKQNTIK